MGAPRRDLSYALVTPDRASRRPDRGDCRHRRGLLDGLGFGLVVVGGVACGVLFGLWYSLAYIEQTGDRRLVKQGYEPGTLRRALRERYNDEHDDEIARYRQMYRGA
ncbi:MAG TPA: DUF5313 family protein [Mycobacterium sp.]|nr:DUF5313 family protein [Mycobacterium sp.]